MYSCVAPRFHSLSILAHDQSAMLCTLLATVVSVCLKSGPILEPASCCCLLELGPLALRHGPWMQQQRAARQRRGELLLAALAAHATNARPRRRVLAKVLRVAVLPPPAECSGRRAPRNGGADRHNDFELVERLGEVGCEGMGG